MGKSSMKRVIGLMSGTSMDGIDLALIETDGEDDVRRLGSAHSAYEPAFCEQLRQSLRDAATMGDRLQRPGTLAEVEIELTELHAALVRSFMADFGLERDTIDLIAFHGQTVLHRPETGMTVQIGDGPLLARLTGVDVVYDLRAGDVAGGGQGAPLAPVYHRAIVEACGGGPMAVLNIGGVANVTFVGSDGDLIAFDTGPGNALIDDWVFQKTGQAFDGDGRLGLQGRVDAGCLAALMDHPYFSAPPPKSLDRNYFPAGALGSLSLEDGAATLAAFTVAAVAAAAELAPETPAKWLVAGGGRHNRAIMAGLKSGLAGEVIAIDRAGFDGDMIEAEAWAYLGVRSIHGLPLTYPGTTGVRAATTGGVLVRA